MTQTPTQIVCEQEIGLQLPDGTKIFSPETWHNRPVATAADREVILATLRAAAANLGYPDELFLERYHWVTREKISAVSYEDENSEELPITSTGFITGFAGNEEAEDLNGEVVEGETVQTAASAE